MFKSLGWVPSCLSPHLAPLGLLDPGKEKDSTSQGPSGLSDADSETPDSTEAPWEIRYINLKTTRFLGMEIQLRNFCRSLLTF